MSDELFEVAFSGKIAEGADLAQVKAKVGAMFKADAAKLAQLFSGSRIVIKKNIDAATAKKYQVALKNAGAVCEVKSLSKAAATAPPAPAKAAQPAGDTRPASATTASKVVASDDIPAAPQTDPLGITAADISDLSASIAPVGSQMQDEIKQVAEPQLDIGSMAMAPVGSDLGQIKKGEEPPPPDTSGITLVDE